MIIPPAYVERTIRHVAPIGADRAGSSLPSNLRGLAGLAIVKQDRSRCCAGPERHVAPVGADRGFATTRVPLLPRRIDADARGLAGLAVTNKDIFHTVRVLGDQVVGIRRKRHIAPVGADRVESAGRVPLRPRRTDADARGLAGLTVTDKGIGRIVRVTGDQVVGIRRKRHVAAVGADRDDSVATEGLGNSTRSVSLRPLRTDADARSFPSECVVRGVRAGRGE